MSIFVKVKRWYLGGPLPTREETENGGIICRSPDTFEPSISARIAQYLVKHLPGITAAVFAASIALYIYFDGKSTEKVGDTKPNREQAQSVKPVVVVPLVHEK